MTAQIAFHQVFHLGMDQSRFRHVTNGNKCTTGASEPKLERRMMQSSSAHSEPYATRSRPMTALCVCVFARKGVARTFILNHYSTVAQIGISSVIGIRYPILRTHDSNEQVPNANIGICISLPVAEEVVYCLYSGRSELSI